VANDIGRMVAVVHELNMKHWSGGVFRWTMLWNPSAGCSAQQRFHSARWTHVVRVIVTSRACDSSASSTSDVEPWGISLHCILHYHHVSLSTVIWWARLHFSHLLFPGSDRKVCDLSI